MARRMRVHGAAGEQEQWCGSSWRAWCTCCGSAPDAMMQSNGFSNKQKWKNVSKVVKLET
jgi:hypothetical protein